MDWYATCAPGLEPFVARELDRLGIASAQAQAGVVAFAGTLQEAYRVCVWSHVATSVVAVLAKTSIASLDELAAFAEHLPWEASLGRGVAIAISIKGSLGPIGSLRKAQASLERAIAARMLDKTGTLPPYKAPRGASRGVPNALGIVLIANPPATPSSSEPPATAHAGDAYRPLAPGCEVAIGIDLCGEPLWKRGYERLERRGLPTLRADIAAAALMAGGWDSLVECKRAAPPTLAVMYSGAATLVAEAASMAKDIAPGLLRLRWGFEQWLGHSLALWTSVLASAKRRRTQGAGQALRLIAVDDRKGSRDNPRSVLRAMGLEDVPRVCSLAKAASVVSGLGTSALALADLSWVDPTQPEEELLATARLIPFCGGLDSQQPGVLVSCAGAKALFDLPFRRPPQKAASAELSRHRRVTLSTTSDLSLPSFAAPLGPHSTRTLAATSPTFARTLMESAAHTIKAAADDAVSCYRVFDRALAGYPVALDLYQGASPTPGRWLVMSVFATSLSDHNPEALEDSYRLLDVAHIAPLVLDVSYGDVELKLRQRAKGGSQYAQHDTRPPARKKKLRKVYGAELPFGSALIEEGGLLFEVNLGAHVDTGIFLDTRAVRARLREMAKALNGKGRFLNLFGYTGTASCYAADGGCPHTTTVDLSATYLAIAQRNLLRNGFMKPKAPQDATTASGALGAARQTTPPPPHEFIRADALSWIREQRRGKKRWDLIYCDPPTFSNSKAMRASFDVQRDHLDLIIGLSRLLSYGGTGVFCCNLSSFAPDLERLSRAGVELTDITQKTIPFDFRHDPPPHHCYLVQRTNAPH